MMSKYKRVILKISGEALAGEKANGIRHRNLSVYMQIRLKKLKI